MSQNAGASPTAEPLCLLVLGGEDEFKKIDEDEEEDEDEDEDEEPDNVRQSRALMFDIGRLHEQYNWDWPVSVQEVLIQETLWRDLVKCTFANAVFLAYYTSEEAIKSVMAYLEPHLVVRNRPCDTEGYVLTPHEARPMAWGQCKPPPYKPLAEEIDRDEAEANVQLFQSVGMKAAIDCAGCVLAEPVLVLLS
ncbi:hypothetical protein GGF31_001547 [Allomyces arbusculus]|nr:hypothetical protein GGF31_001547 [Allomyces arbusculus]